MVNLLDVVAKDKCFHFSYARENPSEDEDKEVSEHFDFGLYGEVIMTTIGLILTNEKVESNLLMLIIEMS